MLTIVIINCCFHLGRLLFQSALTLVWLDKEAARNRQLNLAPPLDAILTKKIITTKY